MFEQSSSNILLLLKIFKFFLFFGNAKAMIHWVYLSNSHCIRLRFHLKLIDFIKLYFKKTRFNFGGNKQ